MALAALAAAAVAALAIPLALDDDPPTDQAGPVRTSAPAGTPESTAAPGGDPTGGATASATGTPTSAPSAAPSRPASTRTSTAGPAPGTIPAGFRRYVDPTDGFSVVIPQGWAAVRRGAQVRFRDPSSGRFLMVETTDSPQPDPYINWLEYEEEFSAGKTGYQNLGIRRVTYRGWDTADWEFIYGNHVLNRNIRVNDERAHALYWSTPPSLWSSASSRQIFDVAAATFQPAPTT